MRGLAKRGRCTWAASGTALAGLAAVGLFAVSCDAGGTGTRDAGPARTDPVARATPSDGATTPPAAKRVNAVALLQEDPKVSETVKRDLKPCVKDEYPVDTSYGKLTGSTDNDVVVNVMTCGDAVGIGTYVYREQGNSYANVFAAEAPAVYAEIDRGDLVLTKPVYGKNDPMAYPSGEEVITYRWSGNKFTVHDQVHNDFSRAVGGDGDESAAQPSVPTEN
ncbi:hypothetical protein [Streptomyces sp. H27-C3]|uniref:hypothetical protein n=1 Tax=Streptomyces sp. H27-C3 TaxID=3046305 RepID=UPI0024BA18DD|nr:hypothetical protein [Streptomyces sp. H27-C3]MDJ0466353.1 hypothetical protein [Streptomyces sp. H27-C3]